MTINFSLPAGFTGDVSIDADGKVTLNGSIAAAVTPAAQVKYPGIAAFPTLAPGIAEALEDLLRRQKGYDADTRSREVAELLISRHWQANPHAEGKYFRWVYAGKTHEVSLYMSSKDLNNARKSQRDFMVTLPGVDVHTPDVRVPFNGGLLDQAVENITAIEKWAEGE